MSIAQLTQEAKISGGGAPIDITGAGMDGDIVLTKLYRYVTILVYIGNIAAATTLTVEECTTVAPGASTAIAFNYRKATTGTTQVSDIDAAIAAATSSGISIGTGDDNKLIAIEIDADELTDGYPGVRARLSSPAGACLATIINICRGARFLSDIPPTAVS